MISVDVIKMKANPKNVSLLLNKALVDAAVEVGKGIKQDYEATVETWNDKPNFKQATKSSSDEIVRQTWTTNDIYRYVHDGTTRRYAVLSSDFEPKTIPGFLGSFPGRGGVIRMDYSHPLPGIIARNFTASIAIKRSGKMYPIALRHLRKAVNASGFAYP